MLLHRLATGLSLVVIVLLVLLLDDRTAPWYPLSFILAMVVLGATSLEVVGLLKRTSAAPLGSIVFGGVLAIVVANWVPHIVEHLTTDPRALAPGMLEPVNALAWPLCVFTAIVMLTFVSQSVEFDGSGGVMARISGTVLAVAYVGLLGSFLIQFRWLPGPHQGFIGLVATIATIKGADTGAYTLGRLAGRHKLWPRLSPNKTVEGAFGGLLFAVGFASIAVAIAHYGFRVPTLSVPGTIGFGIVVGTAAQLGDLMESMIKRDCAQKDASDALPGFGGVLDVLDSILFAGPVAYGYWLTFGP
jgi:phosphatidate cytidylyltransferase